MPISNDSPPAPGNLQKPYWLYLLECEGGSYYCGIAVDVQQRLKAHQAGKGAAYTRAWRPIRVLGARQFPDRGSALKAEYALKQLPRTAKFELFKAEAVRVVGDKDRSGQVPGRPGRSNL